MTRRLIEHILSILFVVVVFLLILAWMREADEPEATPMRQRAERFVQLKGIDPGTALDRALLRDALEQFYPGSAANDSLISSLNELRAEQFSNARYKTGGEARGLTGPKLVRLGGMYLQFLVIYVVVMLITYAAAQSLAIYRFVRLKQNRESTLTELVRHVTAPGGWTWKHLLSARTVEFLAAGLFKFVLLLLLFSPAYVIAYAFKTRVATDTVPFMVILGVLSNGLLINYANKFYTFLVAESRKGYVSTAVVKNLHASYTWGTAEGIPHAVLLFPWQTPRSHVFSHIYLNARYQYFPALKEHASFLITGLVIIEMALNIQGHLGYEMLQNILYHQYDVVVAIVLGIFIIVKGTEILVDTWSYRTSRRYENV